MPDQKISQLPTLSFPATEDLLPVIDNPTGTPTNKKISLGSLFSQIPGNLSATGNLTISGTTALQATTVTSLTATGTITGTLEITGNNIRINQKFTPGSSSLADVDYPIGRITYDENYLYIKTSTNTIKRVSLTAF